MSIPTCSHMWISSSASIPMVMLPSLSRVLLRTMVPRVIISSWLNEGCCWSILLLYHVCGCGGLTGFWHVRAVFGRFDF